LNELWSGGDVERYAAIQQAINAATGEGATLTEEQTAAITRQAGALYDLERQAESLKAAIDNITAAGEEFGTAMGKALADAVFGFGNLRDAAKAAFQDMVTSILQELGKLAASRMLQMILGGAGGGGFSLGGLKLDIPFMAAGGIVTRPTLAVVGEKGAEAVVPLSRGPEFGLGKAGREPAQVTIHNHAGAEVETRETDSGMVEVIIRAAEKRVADGISRGTGLVGRALEGTYGISRRGR